MSWLRNEFPANALPATDQDGSHAELVAQARLGDARAIALLYRRYLNSVYDFAAHRLRSREAAEDATQAIFLKAFSSIDTCRDGARFPGWLFAIARNVMTDGYRSGRVAVLTLDDPPPTSRTRPTRRKPWRSGPSGPASWSGSATTA